MSVLFSDLLTQIDDFCTNYNISNIDLGNKKRAANRAIEFVQRRLGLPSDKKIQSFYFYEDVKYYDCSTGFNELIGLSYNTSANSTAIDQDPNVPRNEWNIFKDEEILKSTGVWPDMNQVGFSTVNGKNQYLMHGRNQRGATTINALNSISGLTFSSDVTATKDSYVYKFGAGSVSMNIAIGQSVTTITFTGVWDITQFLNVNAAYRMYIDFPTGTTGYFSSVDLRLQSSTNNYYSMTTTTQSDGTAWNSGSWSLISWMLANATSTGTPAPSQITTIQIRLVHSGSFATTTALRVNYFYQITPDYIDAMYYSAYKGTDTTGVTPKINLDTDSDICSFGTYAPDLIHPISLKAAQILSPQLLQDLNFRALYKEDFEESIRLWGRTYPRSRGTGQYGATKLKRAT